MWCHRFWFEGVDAASMRPSANSRAASSTQHKSTGLQWPSAAPAEPGSCTVHVTIESMAHTFRCILLLDGCDTLFIVSTSHYVACSARCCSSASCCRSGPLYQTVSGPLDRSKGSSAPSATSSLLLTSSHARIRAVPVPRQVLPACAAAASAADARRAGLRPCMGRGGRAGQDHHAAGAAAPGTGAKQGVCVQKHAVGLVTCDGQGRARLQGKREQPGQARAALHWCETGQHRAKARPWAGHV